MHFLKQTWRACAALFLVLATLCATTLSQSGRTITTTTTTPPAASATPTPQQQTPSTRPTPTSPSSSPQNKTTSQDDDDGDVERVETELTNVLLTALDKNRRFVTTLKQEDIRVLEDGALQNVSIFQRETDMPLSLVILVDTSASQQGVLKDEQEAARAFVDTVLRPGKDQAAVISFTGAIKIEQELTGDRAKLHEGINRVKVLYTFDNPVCEDSELYPEEQAILCYTGVWNGIWLTIDTTLSKTPENTRRAIILLSDGDDTSKNTNTVAHTNRQEAIDYALEHNTTVYSIGIRDENSPVGSLDRDALRKVSEQTGGRVFFPLDKEELVNSFHQIEQELRAQYLIAYSPTNKKRDGSFRQIKLDITNPELRKQKLRLLYRRGYYARRSRQ